ncbi:hypothetical protein EZV61_08235 [Corallincola luteus]|uniref:Uncharacterized protein n=1 Tax=Corallincola luteus TaxID=1775177 RepID=A0ABY2AML1_9GAMM|nr:hypothetical protein [Corallincola luteus]TCI03527.1 hypothetical protein EZV61_08235 [Corallincola luteus]
MPENRQLDTERRMFYFLPALAVIMVLATVLLSSQDDAKREVEDSAFNRLTNNFLVRLNMVRTQWTIHGRPPQLELEGTLMTMGKFGIPDLRTPYGSYDCHELWRLMLAQPMEINQRPISAVAMVDRRLHGEYCRYLISEEVYFDVDLRHGTLSQRAEKLRAIQQNGDEALGKQLN